MALFLSHLSFIASIALFVVFGTPNDISFKLALWLLRLTIFSLFLRTYFGPWLLALMSNHIRVRSISFRSIRGLYFRRGCCTWRVERVGYVWSSFEGSKRLALKLDGLSLEIGMAEPEKTASPPRRHIRNLTLADLNPSPLAHRMWSLISTVTVFLEPFFRPLIRTYVVACLRIGIQLLPMLSQALSFDLRSVVLTFAAVPEAEIVAEQISIHASVDFTQLEPVIDLVEMEEAPRPRDPQKASGMSIWKRRLTESFHRSLDRAWGMTMGTAAIALKIHNIAGMSPGSSLGTFALSDSISPNVPFQIMES